MKLRYVGRFKVQKNYQSIINTKCNSCYMFCQIPLIDQIREIKRNKNYMPKRFK